MAGWVEKPGTGWWRGQNGVRAGWRAAVFIALVLGLVILAAHLLPRAWVAALASRGRLTPGFVMLNEALIFVPVLLASAAMLRLEGRGLGAPFMFGGPRRAPALAAGAGTGLALICTVMILLAAMGAAHIAWGGLGAADSLRFAFLWAIASLFTGLAEELSLRGYLLRTLWRGLGFWPALLLTSVLFALLHLPNRGEAPLGLLSAGIGGAILALGVRGTGSLWWSIGLHGAWDYAENFIWGVPDSGQLCAGTLLRSTPRGPAFLSGGATGPEGSVIAVAVLAGLLAFCAVRFERREI